MNENMNKIMEALQRLRDLDNWPDSELKSNLINCRNGFRKSTLKYEPNRLMYADPLGNPITIFEWSSLLEPGKPFLLDRHIGEDVIDGIRISTVWMGLNHGWLEELQIFETMIFKTSKKPEWTDLYQERYSTLEQAEEGHKVAIEVVKNWLQTNQHGEIHDHQ